MAKPVKSDRKSVIEQMRKKQKSTQQRQGIAIVGVCVLVGALIVGAAAYQPIKDWWDGRAFDKLALSEIGAAPSACGEITTKPATGNQSHVPVGTQVEYQDAPPAFGKHWNQSGVAPAPFERKFYAEDRPELEALVHNLEHGYTMLWYDESIADDEEALDEIRAIAEKFNGTDNFRYKFIAVPWTSEDENGATFPEGKHIAFTHWSAGGTGQTDVKKQTGAFQYCSEISGAALEDFMSKYPYFDSPEPNAL